MILGRKYELITLLLETYTVHNNNRVVFGYENFKKNFNDFEEKALQNLIGDGIASKNGDTVTVNLTEMIFILVNELNILFAIYNEKISACINDENKIKFTYVDNTPVLFEVNFNPKTKLVTDRVIHFCKIYKANYYLFWLDLLNDTNTFQMFVSFIKNEFEQLAYEHRITFNFFDNLSADIVSEIFNVSISSFFKSKTKVKFEEIDFNDHQIIKKFIKSDNLESYKINIDGKDLVMVRNGNKIEFLSIILNRIYYPKEILDILTELRNIITKKVSEYRKIQLVGSTNVLRDSSSGIKLLLSMSGLVLVPVNLVIFTIELSLIIRIISIGLTLSLIFSVIVWIILPSIRIMRFSWEIPQKVKKSKIKTMFRL